MVEHAPPTIMANHDKARLLTMKKTVLNQFLDLRQESGRTWAIIIATAGH